MFVRSNEQKQNNELAKTTQHNTLEKKRGHALFITIT
jgi:hypothetical protein